MKIKKLILNILRSVGFEIKKYNIKNSSDFRLSRFFEIKKIDCLIDVGANSGQYAEKVRNIGYKNQIVSFEPLKSIFLDLKKKSKNDENWEVFNYGLGDLEEKKNINISKNSLSSSILEMQDEHLESDLDSKFVSSELVSIKRLDKLNDYDFSKYENLFLKIDTQGYEDKVLNGSKNILEKINGLQIEMSIYSMYKKQILIKEIFDIVENLGFELWDIERTFVNKKTGKILQFFCIFFKK